MKNLNEKFTHFRYKEHPGDLFRGTVIVPLPDPYKDQENFWIWFHPCFQTSQDVADQIRDEIKSLEQVIYQDCFENFYYLILEGKIESLTGATQEDLFSIERKPKFIS
ncbi:hypothetical protein [Sphingobacterium multivorum]|uniref:hypothetical protein n=1 Tax=Sphingobacterium multivorum TaxID=28454 RepID=UPI0030168E16